MESHLAPRASSRIEIVEAVGLQKAVAEEEVHFVEQNVVGEEALGTWNLARGPVPSSSKEAQSHSVFEKTLCVVHALGLKQSVLSRHRVSKTMVV